MAQGTVTVSNKNLGQGEINAVEKQLIFIGEAEKEQGKLISINSQVNLTELLGDAPALIRQIEAAKANGGQNWHAKVLVLNKAVTDILTASDIDELEDLAPQIANAMSEGVVICSLAESGETKKLIETTQGLMDTLVNQYAQPMFAIVSDERDEGEAGESPSDYTARLQTDIKDIVANRVILAPMTHSQQTNPGVLAGRLCRHDVSIADKPMRVLTGVVRDIGEPEPFTDADLLALDAIRASVPQTYINYPGIYWGDANTLDAPGNDFTLLENLRVADYAGRRIRIRAITMIADRAINATPGSQAYTKNEFTLILKAMAKATTFNGKTYPGMIKPPKENAVVIQWADRKTLNIFFSFQPYESPVEINANITVDLSQEENA